MLHVIWHIVTGFVVGLLARALLPGGDQMGFIATTVLGIVGSVVGGFVGRVIKKPEPGAPFHPAGFVMALLGAIVVLLLWRMIR
jgi:uncharacterized membrane protein YeaQ/YmgE (transglycosylase-associated protein family)